MSPKADRYRFYSWCWIGWAVLDAVLGIWWMQMFIASLFMAVGALGWDARADVHEHDEELPPARTVRR